MKPVLFEIGNFPVRTFGLMMVLAVVVAILVANKRAKRFGLTLDHVLDLLSWSVLPGILGARLAYILLNWKSEFANNPENLWTLRFEGLTSFGGLIMGVAGLLLWAKKKGIKLLVALDLIAVPMLVGWAIGRLGCLLNGCCFGHVCTEGFCVNVVNVGMRVPAQLVDAAMLTVGAIYLSKVGPRYIKRGNEFAAATIIFSISRFLNEFMRVGTNEQFNRGEASAKYLPGLPLSEAQLTSIILIVGAVLFMLIKKPGDAVTDPIEVDQGHDLELAPQVS